MGLPHSYSFSRIVIDPRNKDIVLAGVLGSAWGPGDERGVYRTTDGGKTWKRVLYTNSLSGIADLVMDPKNPNNLLASTWEHYRKPYTFKNGGPGTGIYRSTDGGITWKKITKGLPCF